MDWIIVIYIIIGIVKILNRYTSNDPTIKPAWMVFEKNPIKIFLGLIFLIIIWPAVK